MLKPKREQIFISYAREDVADKEKLASELLAKLDVTKFLIWDDSQMQAGTYETKIQNQIKKSSTYLLLISKDFLKSRFIKKELKWIYHELNRNKSKIIIPVMLKDCLLYTSDAADE